MNHDINHQLDHLHRIIEVQNTINTFLKHSLVATHADELLNNALNLFPYLEFLGVENKGAAFMVNDEQQELVMVASRNLDPELLTLCATVPFDHCLCGRAARSGEILFTDQIDDRHDISFEKMEPHGHYNIPIKVDGQVNALITLYLRKQIDRDKKECLHFLKTIATVVSAALKRLTVEKQIRLNEEVRLFNKMLLLERTVIENAPFGVIVADDENKILVFNATAEQLLFYKRSEVIGRLVTELIPPTLHAQHRTPLRPHHKTEVSHMPGQLPFEAEARRKNGTLFPIRLAINQITVEGQPSFVSMFADISEEKRLYTELVQSEKLAGLGTMVAGVAHEINTPIGIGVTAASELEDRSRIFVKLLRNEGISEEELDAYIASTMRLATLIRTNLERAADLVRSFKSVAVDQSSEKLRNFKVREYVESAILTLHHELKNTRLGVTVICPPNLEIRSNPGAFSQIIINLLNNSRIHAFEPDDVGKITLEFQEENNRLQFIYRDNGKGMSEETRNHIFEPFYTTRRDLGGSGLGMHIVYNLATQTLGGTIACQSAPGCGMSILIDIPLVR